MTKTLISFAAILISFSALGSQNSSSSWRLIDAAVLCPETDNPMTAIKSLSGTSFSKEQVEIIDQKTKTSRISVSVLSNPAVYNPSIKAPVKLAGTLEVIMGYEGEGYEQHLVCHMSFNPRTADPSGKVAPVFSLRPMEIDETDHPELGAKRGSGP